MQRLLSHCVVGNVAVKVGTREDQAQTTPTALSMPSQQGVGRAAGVQGQHHLVGMRQSIGPLLHDAHAVWPQQALPAARCVPVAVVG
jgi:hypothetical protein